jgi:opacity protein-like surface antigen
MRFGATRALLDTMGFVMSGSRALVIVGAVLAGISPARAADMLPPLPELEPPPLRGAVEESSGFYMRGYAGAAAVSASDLRSTFSDGSTLASLGAVDGPVSVGDNFILGVGAGWQFTPWLRADLTAEYRGSASFQSSVTYQTPYSSWCLPGSGISCGDQYTGLVKTGLFLANGYFDIISWYGFTPFVGGGVGVAAYQTTGVKDAALYPNFPGAFGFAPNSSGINFAWSLTGGVAYAIAPNLKFDVAYRYVNMGTFKTGAIVCNDQSNGSCHGEVQSFNMASNDILFGLRWSAPVAAPVPVLQTRY